MATIAASITMRDGVSGPLKSILQVNTLLISSFAAAQKVSANMINEAQLTATQKDLERMNGSLKNTGQSIQETGNVQKEFNQDIKKGEASAERLRDKIRGLAKTAMPQLSIAGGIQFAKDSIESANQRAASETKLKTVMQQRMGATDQMVSATKRLTAVQQQNGVIADDVQMAGAQQLATFLNTPKALNTLIPAMNDLAVQQNGVANTAQSMQSVGNLMGKAMEGQVGVLSQAGLTFSDAQAKAMQYGTEEQKAAVLAQIIANNVGNMNEAIASTPAGQMAQMSNDWRAMKQQIGEELFPAIMGFFNVIKSNAPMIGQALTGAAYAVALVVQILAVAISLAANFGKFITKNWAIMVPIIMGVITVILIYNAAILLSKIQEAKSIVMKGLHTAATVAQTVAQRGLNAVMKAAPFMLLALGIGLIVKAIAQWINHAGGLKIIWMETVNSIQNIISDLVITFWSVVFSIENAWNKIGLAIAKAKVFILNHLGDLKVDGLKILQDFVNGAISIINWFINKANMIPGVSIEPIKPVTFASNAAAENEAKKAARNADLKKQEESVRNQAMANEQILSQMKAKQDQQRQQRESKIQQAQKEAKTKQAKKKPERNMGQDPDFASLMAGMNASRPNPNGSQFGKDMSATAGNTGKMAKSMGSSEDDLKYLRDIAERDTINRFTTAQLSVSMNTTAHIKNDMDIDGVISKLTDKTYEALLATAEGV